jgi:hypothetical protein
MEIFDIQAIALNPDLSGTMLKKGQKVRVTRMVTYEYDVDISDWLDMSDDSEVSVETFISTETEETYELDTSDIEDDVIIAVKTL